MSSAHPADVSEPTWLSRRAAGVAKRLASISGLHRHVFYRYDYMFEPDQLGVLVEALTATNHLNGPILEVGCAAGHSTVFLNRHLDGLNTTRRYYAIDTFAGFTDDDIAVERARGHRSSYENLFRNYDQVYFDQTMANNGVARVTSIRADVNLFDFAAFDQISFCLIDVDLYRPVKASLEKVIPRMHPEGIVVVDDCAPIGKYDGAFQAFTEFTQSTKGSDLETEVRARKLGVIRRGPSSPAQACD